MWTCCSVASNYEDDFYLWTEAKCMSLPFSIGDSATVVHDRKLLVIGGFNLQSSPDNVNVIIQVPVKSTWIFDLDVREWKRGPDLPVEHGITRGSAYLHEGEVYFSGGAWLASNEEPESNQIYEYKSNTKCFRLSNELKRWEVILDLDHFSEKWKNSDYTVLAVFPAKVALPKLKVKKDVQGTNKFMVKYVNINFTSGGTSKRQ